MTTELTSIGNAGFRVVTESARIFIDAFYGAIPGIAAGPAPKADSADAADILLVTHAHWDHFNANETAAVAARTGALVAGPRPVIAELRNRVPASRLAEMEPREASHKGNALSVSIESGETKITAFRTFHSKHHNSYLLETPGFRFFHDGDNEDTRRLDCEAIGRLDALLIGPWQGSGWVEFIEKIGPRRYFLMHLTEEELDEHEAGRFLPGICDRIPPGLTALRPGQSVVM